MVVAVLVVALVTAFAIVEVFVRVKVTEADVAATPAVPDAVLWAMVGVVVVLLASFVVVIFAATGLSVSVKRDDGWVVVVVALTHTPHINGHSPFAIKLNVPLQAAKPSPS
jgi:uncharacterized YccA/Bax inhibitor family protein